MADRDDRLGIRKGLRAKEEKAARRAAVMPLSFGRNDAADQARPETIWGHKTHMFESTFIISRIAYALSQAAWGKQFGRIIGLCETAAMNDDGDDGIGLADEISHLEAVIVRLKAQAVAQSALRLIVDQDTPSYASYAKAIVEGRARLQRFLPGNYFNDPAFDMVLDLFVATETGQKRSFKAAALASRVPPATAARYVDMMARDGIILREADPQDGRRTLLSLSESAMTALHGWLASISSIPLRREWRE